MGAENANSIREKGTTLPANPATTVEPQKALD